MTKRKPPSREICLQMARIYWESKYRRPAYERLSWEYLICWRFYDMYVEDWYDCTNQK